MDYVVFGTGYGATLMLLGWALRTFGPDLRYQDDPDSPQGADIIMARLSWSRFTSSLGAVIVTSGVALILITFIVILLNPGDQTGSRIGWICFALILLAVAVWMWFYVGRFGIYGLLPERQELATLFRSPAPALERVEPSDAVVETAVSAERDDDALQHDAWDDQEEFEPWFEDDEYASEQESRYSKYQQHHPDEVDETEPYDDDELPPEEEPFDGFDDDGEPPLTDVEQVDAEENLDEVGNVAEEPAPEHEPDVSSDEPIDVPEDSPAPVPDERADVEMPLNEEPDETPLPDTELDPAAPEQDLDVADDPPRTLSDTPEGRAEALRRIQEWQPESQDEDE